MNQQSRVAPQVELSEEDTTLVNTLLQINVDAQSGYETAAHDAKQEEHRSLLYQHAQQRQTYSAELNQLLRANRHSAATVGTLAAAFHQGWINLQAILTQGDHAVLRECVRADELAIAAYHDVMHKTSNQALVKILKRQVAGIRAVHDQMAALDRASQP